MSDKTEQDSPKTEQDSPPKEQDSQTTEHELEENCKLLSDLCDSLTNATSREVQPETDWWKVYRELKFLVPMCHPYCKVDDNNFGLSDSLMKSFRTHRSTNIWDLLSLVIDINPNRQKYIFDKDRRVKKAIKKSEIVIKLPYGDLEETETKEKIDLTYTQMVRLFDLVLGRELYNKCVLQSKEWENSLSLLDENSSDGVDSFLASASLIPTDLNSNLSHKKYKGFFVVGLAPNPYALIGLLVDRRRWRFGKIPTRCKKDISIR